MTDHLVLGLGVTGRAVLRALVAHGEGAVAVDDHPSSEGRALADELGVTLIEAPEDESLRVHADDPAARGDDKAAVVRRRGRALRRCAGDRGREHEHAEKNGIAHPPRSMAPPSVRWLIGV